MATMMADGTVRNGSLGSYRYNDCELTVTRGEPLPLGANRVSGGVNFVLICQHATAVRLVLCEPCNGEIRAEIPLDPRLNRTGDHWHVRVDGLPDDFCYGYRVDGPPAGPHRYDPATHPDRPGLPSPLVRHPLGPDGHPAPAQPDHAVDASQRIERSPPRASPWRTRSSTSCTSAAYTAASQLRRPKHPAPSPA